MTANLSKLLNALGLVAIDTVLVVAFADQLWFRDLPCPVCILQRAGFIAAAFGIALNLIYGPRPSHYGIAILGAVAGAIISAWQILAYVVPGSGSYGNTILGLHLYSWAFLMFALIVAGSAVMLLFDRQFTPTEPLPARLTAVADDGDRVAAAAGGRQHRVDARDLRLWRWLSRAPRGLSDHQRQSKRHAAR